MDLEFQLEMKKKKGKNEKCHKNWILVRVEWFEKFK